MKQRQGSTSSLSLFALSQLAMAGLLAMAPAEAKAEIYRKVKPDALELIAAAAKGQSQAQAQRVPFAASLSAGVETRVFPPVDPKVSRFGGSLDVSGDTAVIGARGSDDGRGEVYLYERGSETWSNIQKLPSVFTVEGDNFGWAVAIDGDHIVASAKSAAVPGSDAEPLLEAGAVSFFRRQGNQWLSAGNVFSSTRDEEGAFGYAVDISGTLALIGEPGAEDLPNTLEDPGAAYIYERDASGRWRERQRLEAPDAESGDFFGSSVQLSRVGGSVFAFVSALGRSNQGPFSGAVYIFEQSSSSQPFEYRQTLSPSSSNANDRFGFTISAVGDRLMVGAPGQDDPSAGPDVGAVYVFANENAQWLQQAVIRPESPAGRDLFGLAFTMEGTRAAIASNPAVSGGGVTIYQSESASAWTPGEFFQPTGLSGASVFAESLALEGGELLVGMSRSTNLEGRASGSVSVFSVDSTPAPWGGMLGLAGLGIGLVLLSIRRVA